MEIKVEALVLRTVDYGENDKIVTLFSIEHGKLTARAKGVKRDKAALKFSIQPFAFCEYVLAKKGERYTIIHANLIDAFYDIRKDLQKLYAASAITSILDAVLYENIVNAELFLYTIQALKELTTEEEIPIFIAYFLRVLALSGYALEVERCAVCNSPLQNIVNVDVHCGLFYCRGCKEGAGVSAETVAVLQRASGKAFDEKLCTSVGEFKAIKLLHSYFKAQFDTNCNAVFNDFLQVLQTNIALKG